MHDFQKQVAKSLAPSGCLRAAINLGNAVLAHRGVDGEIQGVSVDLAKEIAARLGLMLDLIIFNSAGKVFEALNYKAWDIAFMAVDPARAAQMDFTEPYVLIEGTYLVRTDSHFQKINELDAKGVRIVASRGSAYELYLRRELKNAELVHADTPEDAFQIFLNGLDALAAVRQPLVKFTAAHAGLRVLDGSFMKIEQAIGIPAGRDIGYRWLNKFMREAKSNGFVVEALYRNGQDDTTIAA